MNDDELARRQRRWDRIQRAGIIGIVVTVLGTIPDGCHATVQLKTGRVIRGRNPARIVSAECLIKRPRLMTQR